ncbi:hypothetical protein [Bradyrhizobium sp. cf659]|uniref:hypothetical protein n=1 Tax=Bradyrhizobium sp. cf659 TaxID=1761771 RepID=UPI0008E56C49|nr:hypothetical protein [Bradyrhizobium sp. cf659]SFH94109.1 hypothetical protein SAMN04487925_1011221 [Bradyrhizobium sp. cf659]
MSNTKPLGQRFSHVYLRRDDLLQDSQRARKRIATFLASHHKDCEGGGSFLVSELGIDVTYGYSSVDWSTTLANYGTSDFLDAITLICRFLTAKRRGPMYHATLNEAFLQTCRRVFQEESLSYAIDDAAGVHFKVDVEFAANTTAAIAALGAPRYANARAEFEKGMAALSKANPDGKEGIRGVFGAAECIYKLMFPKAARLTAADASKSLQTSAQSLYASDPVAQRAASKMVNSFADWVDACHNYRHEQGVEEPSQPPLDLAIEIISAGSGFVRWLVTIDKHMNS